MCVLCLCCAVHAQGGVELATIMLWHYQHTSNETLLRTVVLPWCESLLAFYDQHFPKYPNGRNTHDAPNQIESGDS